MKHELRGRQGDRKKNKKKTHTKNKKQTGREKLTKTKLQIYANNSSVILHFLTDTEKQR